MNHMKQQMEKNQEKDNLSIQKSNYYIQQNNKYIASDNEDVIIDFLSKFYDPISYRKTGRSTVVAKAFIKIAKRYPGKWIKVIDHFPYKDATKVTMDLILFELRKTNEVSHFRFNSNDLSFIFLPNATENE